MLRQAHVLCPGVLGSGGIAAYARAVIDALAPAPVEVLGLAEKKCTFFLPPNARLGGIPEDKKRFSVMLARRYVFGAPSVFVFAHVGLTAPLAFVPRQKRHRTVALLHGIEAWTRLPLHRAIGLSSLDALIFTTAYTRDRFLALNGDRLRAHPSIDIIPLSAAARFDDQRPDRISFSRPHKIVCVSRLAADEPLKGIDTLLRAMRRLDPKMFQLSIVGDGEGRARYEHECRRLGVGDRVTFRGFLSDEDKSRAIAEAEMFCLPSSQEGFGIVYLEAMALGRPSIGVSAGAVPEVITSEVGELAAPGDDAALAAAIHRVRARIAAGDPESERIREVYDRCFAWRTFRSRWTDYVGSLRRSEVAS